MKSNILTELRQLSYKKDSSFYFNTTTKDNLSFVQRLKIVDLHKVHKGCVNTICWDDWGNYILSGSDDLRLVVFDPFTGKVRISYKTRHLANIFCAKFLPQSQNEQVVSSSASGHIFHTHLDREDKGISFGFNCHIGAAYELATIPNDPFVFMSCGEDCTVRWFDLRIKSSCTKESCSEDVLVNCNRPIMSLSLHPLRPFEFAAGCSDSAVRIFDRRQIVLSNNGRSPNESSLLKFTCPTLDNHHHRITSLHYNEDGSELLVSYSSEHLYLFDFKKDGRKFKSILKTSSQRHEPAEFEPSLEFRPSHRTASSSPESSSSSSSSSPSPSDQPQTRSKILHGNPLIAGVSKQLPIKRLRLRGDWSDTGPQARPESERPTGEPSSGVTSVMERMSNLMTRWLERNLIRDDNTMSPGNEDEEPAPNSNNVDVNVNDDEGQNVVGNGNDREAQSTSSVGMPEKVDAVDLGEFSGTFNDGSRGGKSLNIEETPKSEIQNDASSVEVVEEPIKRILFNRKNVTRGNNDTANSTGFNFNQNIEKLSSEGRGNASINISSHAENPKSLDEMCEKKNNDIPGNSVTEVAGSSKTKMEMGSMNTQQQSSQQQQLSQQTQPQEGTSSQQQQNQTKAQQPGTSGLSKPTILISSPSTDDRSSGSVGSIRDRAAKTLQTFFSSRFKTGSTNDKMAASKWNDDDDENDDGDSYNMTINDDACFRPAVTKCFKGHRNSRTLIKEASFWGNGYVMSGSDCGHIFIWDRYTTELVMLMEGDKHVVNCLQPHPTLPVLASSGIDYDVKIWMPLHESSAFDYNDAGRLMYRNEIMLEETKGTVTVPAEFMFRIFSSLSRIRRGNRVFGRNSASQE